MSVGETSIHISEGSPIKKWKSKCQNTVGCECWEFPQSSVIMSLRWENKSCKLTQAVSHIRMQLESFIAATWNSSPGVVTNVMASAIFDGTRIIFCITSTNNKKTKGRLDYLIQQLKECIDWILVYRGSEKKTERLWWVTCYQTQTLLRYLDTSMFLTSIDILLRERQILV